MHREHDSYWRFHRRRFLELVPRAGRLTLDIGGGEGRVARDLQRLGHHVVEFDGSPVLARAAARPSRARRGRGGRRAPGSRSRDAAADLVVAFMSLQDIDRSGSSDQRDRACAGAARTAVRRDRAPDQLRGCVRRRPWRRRPTGSSSRGRTSTRRAATASEVDRDGYRMTFHSLHRSIETGVEPRSVEAARLVIGASARSPRKTRPTSGTACRCSSTCACSQRDPPTRRWRSLTA